MITKVTITGADDSIHPSQLAELSAKYPFVEWGILFSRDRQGSPRFPGARWLLELGGVTRKVEAPLNLSMHICGEYSRDVLKGGTLFTRHLPITLFDRIQVNANASSGYVVGAIRQTIETHQQFEWIFQYKAGNEQMIQDIAGVTFTTNMAVLFDSSGGRGIQPGVWPAPLPRVKCGYAGGLGPENLYMHMIEISRLTGEAPVWIDMESGVRSLPVRGVIEKFDLKKVEQCLQIAEQFISKPMDKTYNTRVIVGDYEQMKKIADYNNKPVNQAREIYFPTEVYTHLPGSSKEVLTFSEWEQITSK